MSIPKVNINKTVSVIVLLAVVVLVTFLSVQHWNNYSQMTARAQAKAVAEQAQAREQERLESVMAAKQATAKYELVRIECEKGLFAWAQLAPKLRNSTPTPVCGPAAAN